MTRMISFEEGDALMRWDTLCDAFAAGHRLAKAEISDTFLYRGEDTLLNRAAWISGMGLLVKAATIFPNNPKAGRPVVNGAVNLFSDQHGTLDAVIDFHLITKWKTAGDSLFAAKRLARPDSREILIVGAGTVGRSLHSAYASAFPDARFKLWNRSRANAEKMARAIAGLEVVDDLEQAVRTADIITSATMSTEPLINGAWLRAGQHVDLIGAYRPDMREVDDVALQRARVFVDSYDTTLAHIGELMIPLVDGAIARSNIVADYYDDEKFARSTPDEITLFKNGGGAHLDLMTARCVLEAWEAAQ